jgi:hypothetical protein
VKHSNRVHNLLNDLLDPVAGYKTPSSNAFADSIVDAAIMPIFPSDPDHLNPTFAFCASTGFRRGRVTNSIADGCFQSFMGFVSPNGNNPQPASANPVLLKTLQHLRNNKLPEVTWNNDSSQEGLCPFFKHSADVARSHSRKRFQGNSAAESFQCPFYRAWELQTKDPDKIDAAEDALAVYRACKADKGHRAQAAQG